VGSEKGLGFGRDRVLTGKAREQEVPQRRVYKHASERIGVRIALRAFKPCEATVRSGLVPQGTGSAWMKRHAAGPEARWKSDTTEGVLGRSSILSRRDTLSRGALFTGANGGTILVRRVNPTSRATDGACGGSYRSAWNRHGGARGRHETSEDGTISMKAPPAVAKRPSAGGQHPERREALPRHERKGAVPGDLRERWGKGASGSDRPKRA